MPVRPLPDCISLLAPQTDLSGLSPIHLCAILIERGGVSCGRAYIRSAYAFMQHRNIHPYPTDQDLYTALSQRDEQAYQYLYTEAFPSFRYWMLNNSASEMDAEDAFQKGMLSFLLNIETGKYQFQPGTRVTTVVFEYCKRVWLTELKSARLRMRGAMPEVVDIADSADIVDDLERLDIVRTVRMSLEQLKEDCRQLMEWFYVDELSLREISERLGMKESSARSKRYSCAEKLKAFYQQAAYKQGL